MSSLNSIQVLDVNITANPEREILEYIVMSLKEKGKKLKIYTPNPEIIMYGNAHPEFKAVLNSSEVALPDGIGVVWAARALQKKLQGRITGVDFMQKLCKRCERNGVSIGLLGGQGGVAELTAECLWKKYPGLKIEFIGEEWGDEGFVKAQELKNKYLNLDASNLKLDEEDRSSKIENQASILNHQDPTSILKSQASNHGVLFVAFGFPKQEKWIAENIDKIPFQAAMGVGGAFDYLSGGVSRAPAPVRSIGLEWFYRLARQPWRAKRQLALPKFMGLVMKEKFMGKSGI